MSLLRLGTSKYAALDFDSGHLRVAQFSFARGYPRVRALQSVAMPEDLDFADADAVGAFIGKTLAGLRLAGCRVVLNVSRGQAVLKPLALPAGTPSDEVAGMVHFQIGKELPFPAAEAVIDFTIERHLGSTGGDSDGNGLNLLVAAVRQPVVEFYRQVAGAAGVKLQRLGLRPYANMRCVDACTSREPDECVVMVDINADETEIDFFVGDALAFSRTATVAAEPEDADGETQATVVDAIVLETVRSIQSFQAVNGGGQVDAILVAGHPELAKAVATEMGQRVEALCEEFRPGEALGLRGERPASAFSAALGSAMAPRGGVAGAFDFLDPKRPTVKRDPRRIKVMAAALVVMVAFCGSVAAGWTYLDVKEQQRAAVARQAKEAEKAQKALAAMATRADAIEDWAAGRVNWLEHWSYLAHVLPDARDVYVTSFKASGASRGRAGRSASSGQVGVMTFTLKARDAGLIDRVEYKLGQIDGYAVAPGPQSSDATDAFDLGYIHDTTVKVQIGRKATIELTDPPPGRPADDASAEVLGRRGKTGRNHGRGGRDYR